MSRMKKLSFVGVLLCCLLIGVFSSESYATEGNHEKLCKDFLLERKWGKLAGACKQWSQKSPKNVIPLILLALAYESDGLYLECYATKVKERKLKRTLQYDEKAWSSWVERLVEDNPESPAAHLILGAEYYSNGKFHKAIEHFRKATQLDPAYTDAHSNLAGTLAEKEVGRFDEAITSVKKALEIHPKLAPAWCNLGLAYGGKGRLEQEASAYKKSIECSPDFAMAHYNLGTLLYEDKKKYQEAEKCFKKAVDLYPTYYKAWYNLGHLYLNKPTPENDKAIVCLKKSVDSEPAFPDAYVELGIAYKRKRMYSEAIDAYKKHLALRSNNPVAYFNLGVSFYRHGLKSEAKEAFRKASELDPDGQLGSLSRQWLDQIE